MNCGNISTGSYTTPRPVCPPEQNTPLMKSPGKIIFFSPESPVDIKYSPSVTVEPGQALLITSYNWNGPTAEIYVNSIVKSTTPPRCGGNNCNPCDMAYAYGTDGVIVFRQRMLLGKYYWAVTAQNSQLLIALPGMYELEVQSTEMLGRDLEVEGVFMPAPHNLPEEYFAGFSQTKL